MNENKDIKTKFLKEKSAIEDIIKAISGTPLTEAEICMMEVFYFAGYKEGCKSTEEANKIERSFK